MVLMILYSLDPVLWKDTVCLCVKKIFYDKKNEKLFGKEIKTKLNF